MYQAIAAVAAVLGLLGGGFYFGKEYAEGQFAEQRKTVLEEQARRLQKQIDDANERARVAEQVRDEIQARAAAERSKAQTNFANLRRRTDDANLTTITEGGRKVDLDQYPFSDEFVRLFDGASRIAGGQPADTASSGGDVVGPAAGPDSAVKPTAR